MGYFSNGTEGLMYQEHYCFHCAFWNDDEGGMGCPVWLLHELHVGDKQWQPTLDKLIPMVDSGHGFTVSGECETFVARQGNGRPERPLTPGQQAGLEEWKQRRTVVVANL